MGDWRSLRLGSRVRRGRRMLAAVALAVALSTLAACSAGRSSLGTSSGPCYVALPTASGAVGQSGHLDGVRLMKVSSINYPLLRSALRQADVTSGRVCLVAFTGSFSSASVADPRGTTAGHAAVVVLRYPDGRLVATVLFARLPTHFGHSHFG